MGVLTSTQLLELLEQQREIRVTLPFCEHTLAKWEEEFGAAHPSTARVRYNLARVLLADGRPEEALALSEAAHETSRLVYGSSHPWTERIRPGNGGVPAGAPRPRQARVGPPASLGDPERQK